MPKLGQKWWEEITFKCEHKVVKKFALEIDKAMRSLCPIDNANDNQMSS